MKMGKMGRWMSGGIVLPALLVVAGCSDEKPPAEERSIEENLSDTRPIVPPPAPVPAAPQTPAPIQAETPRIPPPAEPPSAEAQMQDDAAASGMTSQTTDTDENTPPPAPDNSN